VLRRFRAAAPVRRRSDADAPVGAGAPVERARMCGGAPVWRRSRAAGAPVAAGRRVGALSVWWVGRKTPKFLDLLDMVTAECKFKTTQRHW